MIACLQRQPRFSLFIGEFTKLLRTRFLNTHTQYQYKMSERPAKRIKLNLPTSSSLNRDISPPPLRRESRTTSTDSVGHFIKLDNDDDSTVPIELKSSKTLILSSPFKLTRIKDLPASKNVDTVSLKEIIGDPLINELWCFNYMHSIPFIVDNMDEDTRKDCKIKIIHGNWKSEDPSRLKLQADVEHLGGYKIELIAAYMPEMFGTHHTKMMVIFRHDNTAEVVVHTANMIPFDWTNMTQGVWQSPRLPLLADDTAEVRSDVGYDFKQSFLAYVDAYGKTRCGSLAQQLRKFDFQNVRAVFVGHVPGRHPVGGDLKKHFGWLRLKDALADVTLRNPDKQGEIVAQISSIASLGATDAYLTKTIYPALSTSSTSTSQETPLRIVWPTVEDIRTSINGFDSGSAVHTKGDKPAAVKQLAYIRSYMHTWSGTGDLDAGRRKAAPHIKTFTRFSYTTSYNLPPTIGKAKAKPDEGKYDKKHPYVDWSLLTSANLSQQAWGAAVNASEATVRCCSYEAGVLIYPALWNDLLDSTISDQSSTSGSSLSSKGSISKPRTVEMRAVGSSNYLEEEELMTSLDAVGSGKQYKNVLVSVRLPYDYPLTKYSDDDMPWIAEKDYGELRDWMGSQWPPRY